MIARTVAVWGLVALAVTGIAMESSGGWVACPPHVIVLRERRQEHRQGERCRGVNWRAGWAWMRRSWAVAAMRSEVLWLLEQAWGRMLSLRQMLAQVEELVAQKDSACAFLLALRAKDYHPRVIVTDMRTDYSDVVTRVFPKAIHHECIFHALQQVQHSFKEVYGRDYAQRHPFEELVPNV